MDKFCLHLCHSQTVGLSPHSLTPGLVAMVTLSRYFKGSVYAGLRNGSVAVLSPEDTGEAFIDDSRILADVPIE